MNSPSTVLQLTAWVLVAIVVALGSAPAFAGGTPYNLRTEPATPIAGQPFNIVFDPVGCDSYFAVDPTGEFPQYGGVTVVSDVIVARFLLISQINCTEPPIAVTRQQAPALPAGNYSIQLVLQAFPPPPNEDLVETLAIVVVPAGTGAGAVQIPSAGVWSLLGLAMLLGGLGMLSSGRTRTGR